MSSNFREISAKLGAVVKTVVADVWFRPIGGGPRAIGTRRILP